MNKTVMIITNNGNGLYSFRYELIEKLVGLGYLVQLVYPGADRRDEFEKLGCKCIDLTFDSSSTNPIKDIQLYHKLKKIISLHTPDIALLYTIKPCIYAGYILRKQHIPYICTVTGISPALISDKVYIRWVTIILSRIGYNGASLVFFQNQMNEELFSKYRIAVGKHSMIAGSGVNLNKFQYVEYPPEDGFLKLLYLGRVKKIKGIEEFSLAVLKAHENGLKIQCKVVGELGDEMPAFSQAVSDGAIEYIGATNDVIPYIKWCDFLVLPSHTEGMSNVLQEASACGRPVLASDIPGCREVYDQGVTGFGFAVNEYTSLYDSIEKAYGLSYKSRKEMGMAARDKMIGEFDREKVIKVYCDKIFELTHK